MSNNRNFMEMLRAQWADRKFLTVSLNPRLDRMPVGCSDTLTFLDGMIAATADEVCCYQIDPDFFDPMYGSNSLNVVRELITHIHEVAPLVPIIADIQKAGARHTIERAANLWFKDMAVDAITICAYYGRYAFVSALQFADKGIIVNCRTSNEEADELQDAKVMVSDDTPIPLYQYVAWRVSQYWNERGNCALAIGAKHAHELSEIRKVITQADRPAVTPFFVYGISSRGQVHIKESMEESVANAKDNNGQGFSIVTSRSVLYSSPDQGFGCFTSAKTTVRAFNDIIRNKIRGRDENV